MIPDTSTILVKDLETARLTDQMVLVHEQYVFRFGKSVRNGIFIPFNEIRTQNSFCTVFSDKTGKKSVNSMPGLLGQNLCIFFNHYEIWNSTFATRSVHGSTCSHCAKAIATSPTNGYTEVSIAHSVRNVANI